MTSESWRMSRRCSEGTKWVKKFTTQWRGGSGTFSKTSLIRGKPFSRANYIDISQGQVDTNLYDIK